MKDKKILLTGFAPFNNFKVNPSGLLAEEFGKLYQETVVGVELPVDYEQTRIKLLEQLNAVKPEVCICMGLAKGDTFRLETFARKPKEYCQLAGEQRYDSIIPDCIRVYCQNEDGFIISEDCGQYVCESALWSLLDFKEGSGFPEKAAFFLHVPALSDQWTYERIRPIFERFFSFVASEFA